jgi:hypothetical protein
MKPRQVWRQSIAATALRAGRRSDRAGLGLAQPGPAIDEQKIRQPLITFDGLAPSVWPTQLTASGSAVELGSLEDRDERARVKEYLDCSGRPEWISDEVRMIPVGTPKGRVPYVHHVLRMPADEWPEPIMRSFSHLNRSIYVPMQGPSELGASGKLEHCTAAPTCPGSTFPPWS